MKAAQPTELPLFGRHDKSTGLAVSSLSPEWISPEWTAMLAALSRKHIA